MGFTEVGHVPHLKPSMPREAHPGVVEMSGKIWSTEIRLLSL
jgi:hypothetical protein